MIKRDFNAHIQYILACSRLNPRYANRPCFHSRIFRVLYLSWLNAGRTWIILLLNSLVIKEVHDISLQSWNKKNSSRISFLQQAIEISNESVIYHDKKHEQIRNRSTLRWTPLFNARTSVTLMEHDESETTQEFSVKFLSLMDIKCIFSFKSYTNAISLIQKL